MPITANAATFPCSPEQGHSMMDFTKLTARAEAGTAQASTRNALDNEHHTTALLNRILAKSFDSERHMMAVIKRILANATVQAVLPIEDSRAYHCTLASHAANMNGPACCFPTCDCSPLTCRTTQLPSGSSPCPPAELPGHGAKLQSS